MDMASVEGMKFLGAGIAAVGMLGSGIGIGIVFGKFFEAVARQPSMASKLQGQLLLGFALVESVALFAFVIAMMILFK
jgi:F-type H+-transporting ATPase subunit c